MSFGIEVLNESLTVQLDTNYTNLVLVQTGSVTSSWVGTVILCTVTYTSATAPILAIRQTSPYGSLSFWNYNKSGNNHTWQFRYHSQNGITPDPRGVSSISATISYFIFDQSNASETGFGLRINNASGNNIFTYTQKPMNCLGIYLGPRVWNPGNPGYVDYQFPANKTYAYVFAGSNFVLQKYNNVTTTRTFSACAVMNQSNLLRIDRFFKYNITWSTSVPNSMYNDDFYLVADVTGY